MSATAKTQKRSLILQYLTPELQTKLWLITKTSNASNNEKGQMIKDLLTEYEVPYSPLGSGTNRMGVLIDGYAFKIALDEDGMIDNRREFRYGPSLFPHVIKVYEVSVMGLICVTEYVTIFTIDDYREYADEMRGILKDLSKNWLIGDVGITGKNYVNWGFRDDGTICIMDFAYIYSVQYKLFTCSCDDNSILIYDDDYVKLYCPNCGRRYTFGSIRKKLTRTQQEIEIGNMDEQGYVMNEPLAELPLNPSFEPKPQTKKKKKELSPEEKLIKERLRKERESYFHHDDEDDDEDYWEKHKEE